MPPVVEVTAAYTIENPTDQEVQVDFGFPILRGIYLIHGMAPYPDVGVTIDKENARVDRDLEFGDLRHDPAERPGGDRERHRGRPGLARRAAAVRAAWTTIPASHYAKPRSERLRPLSPGARELAKVPDGHASMERSRRRAVGRVCQPGFASGELAGPWRRLPLRDRWDHYFLMGPEFPAKRSTHSMS